MLLVKHESGLASGLLPLAAALAETWFLECLVLAFSM